MGINYIGFIGIFVGILALGLATWSLLQLRSLNALRKIFFTGSTSKDLEAVIHELTEGLHTLQSNQLILENRIKNLKNDQLLGIQKAGVVKFNPFDGASGNLSFVIALLDAHNTGMIITSIHGREQNRIYAKQITEGKCDIQLTQEELQAIERANTHHKNLISK
ncbi:MAG: DUF4446 family protein [Candidatus Doudnabacteria bacterium]|nr:DUF4446 family protein [Candidatus Doudnabacteria bacterium]